MIDTTIWYIKFNEININNIKNLLNHQELKKSNKFLKNRDKDNYIISHAFLRRVLTYYYPHIQPREWTFEETKYGKPLIAKKHQTKLHFNLSHTYSYATIIVTTLDECGIDIEEDRGIILDENLIDLVLTNKEKKIYSPKKRREIFYKFWTLKEAYLKAEGLGFSISPKEVDFSFCNTTNKEKNIYIKDNYQYGTKYISKNIYLSYALKNIRKEKKIELFEFNFAD